MHPTSTSAKTSSASHLRTDAWNTLVDYARSVYYPSNSIPKVSVMSMDVNSMIRMAVFSASLHTNWIKMCVDCPTVNKLRRAFAIDAGRGM